MTIGVVIVTTVTTDAAVGTEFHKNRDTMSRFFCVHMARNRSA